MVNTELIKITLGSRDTKKKFVLTYQLFSSDFVKRWRELLEKTIASPAQIFEGGDFYGKIFYQEDTIIEEMNQVIAIINHHLPKFKISLVPHKGMSQRFLSELHKCFEDIDAHLRPRKTIPVLSEAVRTLNTLVHRAEQFLRPDRGFHIEGCWDDFQRGEFQPEDYQLFSQDLLNGYLYLPYGVTGVPVLSAFYQRSKDPPVPQHNFTPGFMLWFWPSKHFDRKHELERWLTETHNWDISDPKLALGYIPLGKIIGDTEYLASLPEIIGEYNKILNIEVFDSRKAQWFSHSEISSHLDLVPYIDLQVKFDHAACLKEALALLPEFVEHRDYDQTSRDGTARWKSLGLRAINGDATKTRYHLDYGVKIPTYAMTEVAKRCPKTLEFLRQVTDLDKCERVRFMLLEPGACIKVHSDAPDKSVCHAVNIALNMPENCIFTIDANPDGTANEYTRSIPMRDGSAFIVNVAKYHYVVNNSSTPRIHIIVHGPLRYSDLEIIEKARAQNKLSSETAVLQALHRKYTALNLPINDANFIERWKLSGLANQNSIDEKMMLIVVDHAKSEHDLLAKECLDQITKASLFPLSYTVVHAKDLDEWLLHKAPADLDSLFIIAAGTLIQDTHKFIVELQKIAQTFRTKNNLLLMGHLMDWQKVDDAPYLHEQFLALNFRLWREKLTVPLGNCYAPEKFIDFPGYQASKEKIHDHYTPLWIKPNEKNAKKPGKAWWGTQLIAEALEQGLTVYNLPNSLRALKQFAYYPYGSDTQPYFAIKAEIDKKLKISQEKVFHFNNENLRITKLDGFKPDIFISVAAGLKPAAILSQFWDIYDQPEKAVFIDYSQNAISYMNGLVKQKSEVNLAKYMHSWMVKENSQLSFDNVKGVLRNNVIEGFAGNYSFLQNSLQKLESAQFKVLDFIEDHDSLLEHIKPGKKVLLWHSNAWFCNPSYFRYSKEELEENYLNLGRKIAKHHGLKLWKHKFTQQMVLGHDFTDPIIYLTDGVVDKSHTPQSFILIE